VTPPDPQPTERQRRASELVRQAAVEIAAPFALRERVSAPPRGRRRRAGWLAGLSGSLAAVVAVVVLALPSGPSFAQAAGLGHRAPQGPAPVAVSPALLGASVDGVAFPAWADEFGWQASGVRHDTLDGRRATTVFYTKEGVRIAYTIVSGDGLDVPENARKQRTADVDLATVGDAVTWERRGHTCVLSGAPQATPVRDLLTGPGQPAHDGADRHLQGARRLLVGQADDVDRHDDVARVGRQPRDEREYLVRLQPLVRVTRRGDERLEILGRRDVRLAPGGLSAPVEEQVAHHAQQVADLVSPAQEPRTGEDARERVLDQVLRVRRRARQRERGAVHAIDMVA
jgi:hypothetical protein